MLNLAKNQVNTKLNLEAELLLFKIYSLSSLMLSSKTNVRYSENCAKCKCVCLNEIVWLIIMNVRLEIKLG